MYTKLSICQGMCHLLIQNKHHLIVSYIRFSSHEACQVAVSPACLYRMAYGKVYPDRLTEEEDLSLSFHDNYTRNVLRTPANNKLRMEDKHQEEHIKLATEYGKTQLNLGHLVNAQGKMRGAGVELRTDEWGAIRAGKGLFISADEQPKAQGEALDMEAALKEITYLLQQREQLNIAAKQAKALQADIESQKQLLQQHLEPLNQSLLFSAPQGVAFTSGEHLQLAASEKLSINADGDISVGVIGNMTMSTGDKLGLFARTGKFGVVAGEGPLSIQAQNNRLDIFSEQKQTITSAADINFTGKKRIILNGGGSYLKLENGKIEYGTSGDYLRKIPKMATAGPNTLPMKMAQFPQVITVIFSSLELKAFAMQLAWGCTLVKPNLETIVSRFYVHAVMPVLASCQKEDWHYYLFSGTTMWWHQTLSDWQPTDIATKAQPKNHDKTVYLDDETAWQQIDDDPEVKSVLAQWQQMPMSQHFPPCIQRQKVIQALQKASGAGMRNGADKKLYALLYLDGQKLILTSDFVASKLELINQGKFSLQRVLFDYEKVRSGS